MAIMSKRSVRAFILSGPLSVRAPAVGALPYLRMARTVEGQQDQPVRATI